eukprot:PITA_36133
MNEEYQSIMENGVWEIVSRPKDKFVVTSKWLYKIKHAADGSIDKYKARFVARDFSQQEGIDYEETFAPTARLGFTKSYVDLNIYIKVVKEKHVIILLSVDDLLLTGVGGRIQECKKKLAAEFNMKDLGLMHYYLGLEVWQGPNEIYLDQGKYVIEMLKRFDMIDCKPMTTPMITNLKRLKSHKSSPMDPTRYRQLIGSLMYFVNTRPDICFAMNVLSEFQVEPKHDHWIAAKHILRYLQGTIHYCLKYDRRNDVHLIGYTYSNWGDSEQNRRSTTRGCFSLGSSTVSWMSKKQDSIALSSGKAEYIAACEVGREVVWLRKLLSDLFEGPMDTTVIHCDNTSCIRFLKTQCFMESQSI